MATRKVEAKQKVNEFAGQVDKVFLASLGVVANARKAGIETFEALVKDGAELIVTVDCGTTSFEPLLVAEKLGVDVVVVGEMPRLAEGLRDPAVTLLVGVVDVFEPELRSVAEELQEVPRGLAARHDEDLGDPGVDHRFDAVEQDGLVGHRHQLLGTRVRDRPESQRFFREQLTYTPSLAFCYRPPDFAPEVTALPVLKQGATTFGSLNTLLKLNSQVIGLWSRVLQECPQATSRAKRSSTATEDRPSGPGTMIQERAREPY